MHAAEQMRSSLLNQSINCVDEIDNLTLTNTNNLVNTMQIWPGVVIQIMQFIYTTLCAPVQQLADIRRNCKCFYWSSTLSEGAPVFSQLFAFTLAEDILWNL